MRRLMVALVSLGMFAGAVFAADPTSAPSTGPATMPASGVKDPPANVKRYLDAAHAVAKSQAAEAQAELIKARKELNAMTAGRVNSRAIEGTNAAGAWVFFSADSKAAVVAKQSLLIKKLQDDVSGLTKPGAVGVLQLFTAENKGTIHLGDIGALDAVKVMAVADGEVVGRDVYLGVSRSRAPGGAPPLIRAGSAEAEMARMPAPVIVEPTLSLPVLIDMPSEGVVTGARVEPQGLFEVVGTQTLDKITVFELQPIDMTPFLAAVKK